VAKASFANMQKLLNLDPSFMFHRSSSEKMGRAKSSAKPRRSSSDLQNIPGHSQMHSNSRDQPPFGRSQSSEMIPSDYCRNDDGSQFGRSRSTEGASTDSAGSHRSRKGIMRSPESIRAKKNAHFSDTASPSNGHDVETFILDSVVQNARTPSTRTPSPDCMPAQKFVRQLQPISKDFTTDEGVVDSLQQEQVGFVVSLARSS